MAELVVEVGDSTLYADWLDHNPDTRRAIDGALPVTGEGARWGDELYFEIPVDRPLETGQLEVPVGGIAYWPAGNALCLFWGPTPASEADEPRAASPVALVAHIADPSPLERTTGGERITVGRSDQA